MLVGDVVGEDAAVGATIEGEADRGVLLLAGRVPDLQSELLVANCHGLRLEVGADSGLRRTGVVIRELVNEGSLAHVDVSEEDDLGKELLLGAFNHFQQFQVVCVRCCSTSCCDTINF